MYGFEFIYTVTKILFCRDLFELTYFVLGRGEGLCLGLVA